MQPLAATGLIIRFELSAEFTRGSASFVAKRGMKPEESLAPCGLLVNFIESALKLLEEHSLFAKRGYYNESGTWQTNKI